MNARPTHNRWASAFPYHPRSTHCLDEEPNTLAPHPLRVQEPRPPRRAVASGGGGGPAEASKSIKNALKSIKMHQKYMKNHFPFQAELDAENLGKDSPSETGKSFFKSKFLFSKHSSRKIILPRRRFGVACNEYERASPTRDKRMNAQAQRETTRDNERQTRDRRETAERHFPFQAELDAENLGKDSPSETGK